MSDIYVVIHPNNEMSAHTTAKSAASEANLNPITLKRNGNKYAKRGFRIELVQLNKVKGRENNRFKKSKDKNQYQPDF